MQPTAIWSSSICSYSAISVHRCPYRKPYPASKPARNRLMIAGDDRPLQADVVRFRWAVPVPRRRSKPNSSRSATN